MIAVDQHDLLLQLGRHLNPALVGEGVGLQAHSEVRQVDAWLDAERGSRHDRAGVVGLEAVQIDAVGVGLGADAVAQSVYEAVAVAGGGDDPAGDSIDGGAGDGTAGAQLGLEELDRGIAGVADYAEDLPLAVRGRPADDGNPGYVGVDGILLLSLLGPGVDQEPVAGWMVADRSAEGS